MEILVVSFFLAWVFVVANFSSGDMGENGFVGVTKQGDLVLQPPSGGMVEILNFTQLISTQQVLSTLIANVSSLQETLISTISSLQKTSNSLLDVGLPRAVLDPGTRIIFIGGITYTTPLNGFEVNRLAHIYDTTTFKWSTIPVVNTGNDGVGATALSPDKTFLIWLGNNRFASKLNLSTLTWTNLTSMQTSRELFSATFMPQNASLVMTTGGSPGLSGNATRSVEIYNVETDKWSYGTNLTVRRTAHRQVIYRDSIVILAGASDSTTGGNYISSVEMYNDSTQQWDPMPSMPTFHLNFACAVVNDKIYAFGYLDSWSTPFKSLVVPSTLRRQFSVFNGTAWSRISFKWPVTPIGGAAGATIQNKMIFSSSDDATIYVFDPETDTWGSIPPAPTPRWFFDIVVV